MPKECTKTGQTNELHLQFFQQLSEQRKFPVMEDPEKLKLRQEALQKLQAGKELLAKAAAEPMLLGPTLVRFHGALEDQFRYMLATSPKLSAAQQSRVMDKNEVKWRDLSELMQQSGGLRSPDARYILKVNALRNETAHGGEFRGSYAEVAKYDEFVTGWVGSADSTPLLIGRSSLNAAANCCPRCQNDRLKSLKLIHERGISYVQRRRGRSERRQSGLSLRAAPPSKKTYGLALVWSLASFGFVPYIPAAFVPILQPIPVFGNVLAGVVSWVSLVLMIVGIVYPIYRVWKFNRTEYPRQLQAWEQTVMCEQCGHTFVWDAPPAYSASVT